MLGERWKRGTGNEVDSVGNTKVRSESYVSILNSIYIQIKLPQIARIFALAVPKKTINGCKSGGFPFSLKDT